MFSVERAVRFAWPAYKQHFGLFAGLLLASGLAWVALEVVVIQGQRFGLGLWAAAHLVFLLVFAGLEAGLLRASLTVYDGGEPTLAEALRCLALGPKFLAGQVIYLLMVMAGLALLVAPGLYLAARYGLSGFLIVDGEPGLVRSFQGSAAVSRGSILRVLAVVAGLLVFNMLGGMLLGVGLFVSVPLSALMMTAVYRQLATERGPRGLGD